MLLRVGMSRQQYQRLESRGNPRLDTLELVAQGLNSKLMLIPQEKLKAVSAVLDDDNTSNASNRMDDTRQLENNALADDPWQNWLKGDKEA